MLNKRARKIIGYDELVKEFASQGLTEEELDWLETTDVREFLKKRFEPDFRDEYRFVGDVRREVRKDMHEEHTLDSIMDSIPYAAQNMAQEAVKVLLRKAAEGKIFLVDSTVYALCDALFQLLYCSVWDIKKTAEELCQKQYSKAEIMDRKLLRDFVENMRNREWYKHGEVVRLRTEKSDSTIYTHSSIAMYREYLIDGGCDK